MDSSDPSAPVKNSCLAKIKDRTPLNQVMPFKAFSLRRLIQVAQRVAQKSTMSVCQLFCCPLDTLLLEKPACCTAPDDQPTGTQTPQVAHTSPPSTILILNISNSTLIDCVIGNDTYASSVAESQALMQKSHDQMRFHCSAGHPRAGQMSPPPVSPSSSSPELQRINIHGSHLNYVIIGDNNYMHAEQLIQTEDLM